MKRQQIKINQGFIYQDMGDEIIIYSGEKSELFTFNETAGKILRMLIEGKSKGYIVNVLTKSYKIKKERIAEDLNELIENLKENKLID